MIFHVIIKDAEASKLREELERSLKSPEEWANYPMINEALDQIQTQFESKRT